MAELLTNKENLFKYGYCVVRNLLDDKEVQKYRSIIKEVYEKSGKKDGKPLYEYRESWEIIFNDRILNAVRSVLGPNIFYLHDGNCHHMVHNKEYDYTQFSSWHRDNPCRIFGKGPDWDPNEPYNVLRVGLYLSTFKESKSGLNVIPYSHKKKYTFSNVIRLLHYKTKNVNIPFLKKIRQKLEKFIGVNIHTNPGDCIIFIANLLHTGIPPQGSRKSLFLSYGINNKHSKNYVNYYMEHRKGFEIYNQKMRDEIIKFLKNNNIYFPLPEKKEEIKGASVPISDR